jgi:hypothetical protein
MPVEYDCGPEPEALHFASAHVGELVLPGPMLWLIETP